MIWNTKSYINKTFIESASSIIKLIHCIQDRNLGTYYQHLAIQSVSQIIGGKGTFHSLTILKIFDIIIMVGDNNFCKCLAVNVWHTCPQGFLHVAVLLFSNCNGQTIINICNQIFNVLDPY